MIRNINEYLLMLMDPCSIALYTAECWVWSTHDRSVHIWRHLATSAVVARCNIWWLPLVYMMLANGRHAVAKFSESSAWDKVGEKFVIFRDMLVSLKCSVRMSEWVSRFLTAHQHIIGYSVPWRGR